MSNPFITIRYQFTLSDWIDTYDSGWSFDEHPTFQTIVSQTSDSSYMHAFDSFSFSTYAAYTDPFIDAFFKRFYDSYVIESEDDSLTNGDGQDQAFCRKFYSIFMRTYERYCTLLAAYNTAKSMLMNDVENSTETRYSDTPQNEGNFDALTYTTTINQIVSKSQVGTKMERLQEIERGYSDVISDWVNEFRDIFLEY